MQSRSQLNYHLENHPKQINIHSQHKIFIFFVSLCINATLYEEACAKRGSVQNI